MKKPLPFKLIFLFLVSLFALSVATLSYWQLARPDLAAHSNNPRSLQVYHAPRGRILDRNGVALAYSDQVDGQFCRRQAEVLSLSHLIGYFHPRYGMSGLEQAFNSVLSRNQDIHTTLDVTLQESVEDILGKQPGAIVVVHPSTGQILAMVSWPALDLENLVAKWDNYLDDPFSPFLNRATQGQYPPGSAAKPLVLAAGYQQGIISPQTTYRDQGEIVIDGRSIRNYQNNAYGVIDSSTALALSSNVVFAQLAMELKSDLLQCYQAFGLGEAPNLEIPAVGGNLPQGNFSDFGWAHLGIGQGELLVTPLQMAMVAATIANRGQRMEPHLIRVVASLIFNRTKRPIPVGQIVSPAINHQLTAGMVQTVSNGTGRSARLEGISVAGKTGTAENPHGSAHSWFIGFAPAENPIVAISVIVEQGGPGGGLAASLGKAVLQAALYRMEER